MPLCDREFFRRAARVPIHGVGLSVDVYSPELVELHGALEQAGLRPDYWEVFKAPSAELARIRRALPPTRFAYHAEGLWFIDPEMQWRYPWVEQAQRMAGHATILSAAWINHECASKQFAGYSFGTYLPPLFTRAAAEVTAANATLCQRLLDQCAESAGSGEAPLLLLELAPLTYFGFGDVSPAAFFAEIARAAPCGFVLDIGHLWTVWRYRERSRFASLESFADTFLEEFPLHRVIEVHLAGLASAPSTETSDIPQWIDAHHAPVPKILWGLLRRVLAHPGLTSLKGIALEVDTKAIPVIVEEFRELRARVEMLRPRTRSYLERPSSAPRPIASGRPAALSEIYATYAQVVSGQQTLETSLLEPLSENVDREGLHQYAKDYLPNELLHWGGDLDELFPTVIRTLKERGISHQDFVRFWFRQPCPVQEAYDFFYVKLDRWIEFVREVAPDLGEDTQREAGVLRELHAELNDEVSASITPPELRLSQ